VAPQRRSRESRGGVRGRAVTRRALLPLGATFALVVVSLAFALPAGAANGTTRNVKVGDVKVSNGKPVRGGELDVSSDG